MLLKIRIYSIHKEKNVFGNVFQIVYFGVRNIVYWVCVCVCFFIKKKLTTVLHRHVGETLLRCHTALTCGRGVVEMQQCTDA